MTEIYNPFASSASADVWHFFYDESNNCRRFKLDSIKQDFNVNCYEDFVLAGVAGESDEQIPFETLRQRFRLQPNAVELKSKKLFKGMDFLESMGTRTATTLFEILNEQDLYLHYTHVNNLYYALVEIFDSIITSEEAHVLGEFHCQRLKGVLYDMLSPNLPEVTNILIKYSYPNIKEEDISSFCTELMDAADAHPQITREKIFVMSLLKRASQSKELLFIQNNVDYILQEDYSIFYASSILRFPNSQHHFDNEDLIKPKLGQVVDCFAPGTSNYEFVDSKMNTLVQLSDLVSGILGRMFIFLNSVSDQDLSGIVQGLNDVQLCNCRSFYELRKKSDRKNPELLYRVTAESVTRRLNTFFKLAVEECDRRDL